MGVTAGANNRSLVHKDSGGKTIAFPDVCLTPVGSSVVPIPYPNFAKSGDSDKTVKTVKADGQKICVKDSNFKCSTGDEGGSNKGVASGTVKQKAEFVTWSPDVFAEGKNVVRANDMMVHNNKNTAPVPVLQKPIMGMVEEAVCLTCNKKF